MPPRRFKAAAKAPDTSSPTSSAMGSALAERTSTSPGTRRAGSSACSAGSLRKDVGQHSRARALQRCSPPLRGPSAQAHIPSRCPSAARRTPRGSRAAAAGERWMEPCACADIALPLLESGAAAAAPLQRWAGVGGGWARARARWERRRRGRAEGVVGREGAQHACTLCASTVALHT